MTKTQLLKEISLGDIYEVHFKYAYTTNKDMTLCIPKAISDFSLAAKILVIPAKCKDPSLVKKDLALIKIDNIQEVKKISRSDLPLYIGLDTTKSFELLIRQKKSSSRVTRVS